MRIPTLDDRTYDDLVREGLSILASAGEEWTNHNASDPGITLLELLAYATELLTYRVNQITDDTVLAFARLLAGAGDLASSDAAAEQLAAAVLASRRRERLVTCADYEAAAADVNRGRIARAHCVADRDLTAGTIAARRAERPGHVTVLLVSRREEDDLSALCEEVSRELLPRTLITTRVHVGRPEFVDLAVRLLVALRPGARATATLDGVTAALTAFFDPATGGGDGQGWPPGRWIYVSEIYRLLDRVPGVDYVSRLRDPRTGVPQDELLVTDPTTLVRDRATGELVAMRVEPHQLVRPRTGGHALQAVRAGRMVSAGAEE